MTSASFVIPAREWPVSRNRDVNKYVAFGDILFTGFMLLVLLCTSTTTGANEILARQNYILNCQGCHLPDGSGSEGSVPKMNDFVGYFLHVPGGREFIVQVPGAARPHLGPGTGRRDELDAAELQQKRTPDQFVPYEADEIAKLRKEPLIDMHHRREELIARIRDKLGVSEY